MAGESAPVYEFFGAIYGYFFPDDQGRPGALHDAVHRALADERHAALAMTLMDYLAGDVEVQWIGENDDPGAGPGFRMPVDQRGGLDIAGLVRQRPGVYAEAFQVAVARLMHRERRAYGASFALVLAAFEGLHGPRTAPARHAPH